MPVVERTITINAPAEAIYRLIKDVERYPQFIPDVKDVKVVSGDPQDRIARWYAIIDGVEFRWTERAMYDDAHLLVRYRLVKGDLDKFQGEWIVRSAGGRTEVTLTVDYDLGIPSLEDVMAMVLYDKVTMNAQHLLEGIKEEAERVEGEDG